MANKLAKKDISRRDLLKAGGAVAVGAAVALVPKGALAQAERAGGRRLCIKACPYEARFVHPEKKTKSGDARVVNKCTFCIHRVDEGVVPACVNTCMGNARIFGDLNDPKSEVARLVAAHDVAVLEEDAGTMPHVFYIGTPSPLRAEGDPKSIRL